MDAQKIRIVILGGGSAGWMTAAACIGMAQGACSVQLVESSEIGIVGVGEATLPHLRAYLRRLGISEAAFMDATNATYKLGIEFRDFGKIGERYFHPFGTHGRPLGDVDFHHLWLRSNSAGLARSIDRYCMASVAAAARRFAPPDESDREDADLGWAYQLDAASFGRFLRDWACKRGVARTEGVVERIERDSETGDMRALILQDGERIEGDMFIDCSGFRGLLIGDEHWEDWSHWLPCDRAIAIPCASTPGPVEPYTRAQAMPAGWRWRIPLRHRIGNGYVYASAFIDDDDARHSLLGALEGEPVAEPRLLRFSAGRRRGSWVGNVVAIGLSSGFLEPLESTGLYLVQAAITHLLDHFPDRIVRPEDRDGFNAAIDAEYDRIRDFLILHYHASERADSPFWNHVRTMPIPDSLNSKLELWRSCAQAPRSSFGIFLEPSWIAVLIGQNILPTGWDARADSFNPLSLDRAMAALAAQLEQRAQKMPEHGLSFGMAEPS